MAETTKDLVDLLSHKQLKAIWAKYREQNPELQTAFSNKAAYAKNIKRCLDDAKYNQVVIKEGSDGELNFRFNSDPKKLNTKDEEKKDNKDKDDESVNTKESNKRLEQSESVLSTSTSSKGGSIGDSGKTEVKKPRDWAHVDIQSKIYSNSRTTVSICKVNGKEMVLKENRSNGTHEVYMLHKMQGPGVVKLYHADRVVGDHTSHVRIFLEKLNPLPDFTTYSELCNFMRGLLAGLMWLHLNNCVHGDIKPQNVMMSKKNDVKIIDFGYSIELFYKQRTRYLYGNTYAYMAPEILLNEPQTNKIDIFGAGLVCAEKMLGVRIDSFDTRDNLIDKVFDGEMSHLATESGIDLLSSMLCTDPDERPTAEACLDHPFLCGEESESTDESKF